LNPASEIQKRNPLLFDNREEKKEYQYDSSH